MARIIVEATYDPPLSEADLRAAEQDPNPDCYQIRNVTWLRSFVSRDRITICELEATPVKVHLIVPETPARRGLQTSDFKKLSSTILQVSKLNEY